MKISILDRVSTSYQSFSNDCGPSENLILSEIKVLKDTAK